MQKPPTVFPLEAIRTDGWFERVGESIGSFQALCEIVGDRFFAFTLITGANITALAVDRRDPDNTKVEFTATGEEEVSGSPPGEGQVLSLPVFRRRLVDALSFDQPIEPPPERATDVEAIQRHIGVRHLLLAPLFGYCLVALEVHEHRSDVRLLYDGIEQVIEISEFRERLRLHVREELVLAARPPTQGAIDLDLVEDAADAADMGDSDRVLELLGAWPAPLAIFLRTPEGQALTQDVRDTIAHGLALLGTACVSLQEVERGEEILRLAIQYAGDGARAPEIYSRLGLSILRDGRFGESIGPLRRALHLGAEPVLIWPALVRAFVERSKWMAALGAALEAREAGVEEAAIEPMLAQVREELGFGLNAWQQLVGDLDLLGGPVVDPKLAR